MSLYRLSRNTDQYGLLTFSGDLLRKSLGRRAFMSLSSLTVYIGDKWPECHAWFDDLDGDIEITARPDVYIWNYTILSLSPRAKSVLGDQLLILGEFLPFQCGGEEWYLFVPHSVVEADESVSEHRIENGLMMGTNRLGFRSENVGTNMLFKTNYDKHANLYCSESFKSLVDRHQLSGLNFETDLAKAVD